MRDKALSNYEAAKLLVAKSYFESAASRAYYAVYLMAWHFLDVRGENPQDESRDGNSYWRHYDFPDRLCDEYGVIGPIQRKNFELLRHYRIKADYYLDEIEEYEAKRSILFANELILHFASEEGRIE